MTNFRKFIAGFLACFAFIGWVGVADAGLKAVAPGVAATFTASSRFLAADGTSAAPSYAFTNETNTGFKMRSGSIDMVSIGQPSVAMYASGVTIHSAAAFGISSGLPDASAADTLLARDAANTFAQKNGTSAQSFRWYFSTTGPVYVGLTARTHGGLLTGSGGAMQLSTAQTTPPVCSTNCGTTPSVAGSDTAFTITLGTTPASGFLITFNGTWPAAPACTVQMATAGMVVGKQALTAVTTTSTLTVVTNGTAPASADKYHVLCMGVS